MSEQGSSGYATPEEAMAALVAHMQEARPAGHGLHPDAITDEPVRFHQYEHRMGKAFHSHKRPEEDS